MLQNNIKILNFNDRNRHKVKRIKLPHVKLNILKNVLLSKRKKRILAITPANGRLNNPSNCTKQLKRNKVHQTKSRLSINFIDIKALNP